MKYRCMACGYIYDDEAEGVKFEDLPEDWVCPLCGVGKDMFEKVEEQLQCYCNYFFYTTKTTLHRKNLYAKCIQVLLSNLLNKMG